MHGPGSETVANSYAAFMTSQGATADDVTAATSNGSMQQYLVDVGVDDMAAYRNQYITAASFYMPSSGGGGDDNGKATVYFNNEAVHSPAMAVNMFSNTFFRFVCLVSLDRISSVHRVSLPEQRTLCCCQLLSRCLVLFGFVFQRYV